MLMKFLAEIRRRRVIQTIVPYIGIVWLLLQVVSVVVPMLNLHPLVGTFVAIVLFAGFPVVLYLAWHFDFTMEGLVRVPGAKEGEVKSFGWSKWTALMGILGLSIFLGYYYFDEVRTEVAKQEEGLVTVKPSMSIAVIPFRDQSPDTDQAYLAEGLAEELTALLGKISGLKVAASSSTFILAAKSLPPTDIARRLGVDAILTGSVRLTGNRLKVRTELISADDGTTLWTETFTREFTDIFVIESEISRSVVNLLEDRYLEKGEMTTEAKTASTDAYVIYLKGREAYRKQTTESMKQARKLFEQAIGLDPEYAEAYVALADTILMLEKGNSRFGVLDTNIAIELADRELAKALVREQKNARAYLIQGKSSELKQDFDMALSNYDKAISINSSLALAHMWRFLLLHKIDRHQEALVALETAYSLDPESSTTIYNLALLYSLFGKFEESDKLLKRLLAKFPESPYGFVGSATSSFLKGKLAESAKYWQQASKVSPQNENYFFSFLDTLATLGMTDHIRALTDDPSYKTAILVLEGNYNALFKELDFQLQANPDDPWIVYESGWYEMLVGDKIKASELVLQARQKLTDEDIYLMPGCSPAIEIAWALKQNLQLSEAQEVIVRCEKQLLSAKKSGLISSDEDYLTARIAALKNQPEAVQRALKTAIGNGWREWWTEKDPILSGLERTEELQVLFDLIESELDKEKTKAELLFATSNTNQTEQ